MACFLAEGSKFLLFDADICRNTVWLPSGENSSPVAAEECSIGTGALFAISAGSIFFLALILVCLHAPVRRQLIELYGRECDHNMEENDVNLRTGGRVQSVDDSYLTHERGDNLDSYDSEKSFSVGSRTRPLSTSTRQHDLPGYAIGEIYYDNRLSVPTTLDYQYDQHEDDINSLMSERLRSLDTTYGHDLTDIEENQSEGPQTPEKQKISESRLNTIEKMKLNSRSRSDDRMIQKFVQELDTSFHADDHSPLG